MSKPQRDEERLTPKQVNKIFDLYQCEKMDISLIAERYSVEETAIVELLARQRTEYVATWCVAWDDDTCAANKKFFKTFGAAKLFHSRLKKPHWSKIYEI